MSEPAEELQRQTAIIQDFDAYRGFFDHDWCRRFLDCTRPTKLCKAAFALVCDWECLSNARSLPWVLVTCLEHAITTEFEQFEPFEIRKIRILSEKLVHSLERKGEKLRPMLKKKLTEAIEEIDAEFTNICHNTKSSIQSNRDPLWNAILNERSFLTAVWASERSCYGMVYYAYECFVRECIRIAARNPAYIIGRAENTKRELKQLFGDEITFASWSNQQISIARMTRNALVHNGGIVTEDLKKQPHSFRIEEDGLIQIGASDTTILFDLLKQRTLQLAEYAVMLAVFVDGYDQTGSQ